MVAIFSDRSTCADLLLKAGAQVRQQGAAAGRADILFVCACLVCFTPQLIASEHVLRPVVLQACVRSCQYGAAAHPPPCRRRWTRWTTRAAAR